MSQSDANTDIKRKKEKLQSGTPPAPTKSKVYKSSGKLFRHRDKDRASTSSSNSSSTSSSSTMGLSRKDETIDLKDCPLTLPDVTPLDHQKSLPRYTLLATGKPVPLEELDAMQLELELLLSSILVRHISLTDQLSTIEQMEKGKVISKLAASPGKRVRKDEGDKPVKKAKDQSGKAREVANSPAPPTLGSKNLKVKCSVVKNEPLFDVPDIGPVEPAKPPPPKNDITNRFWALVEQYCQEISADDIKMLEDLIASHNEDGDYYKIPPLGRHYTLRWAQEDLQDEQKEGVKLGDVKKKRDTGGHEISDKLLKEVDMNGCNDDVAPLGPLTQRVIAGLVEENVLVSENIENKGVNGVGIGRPGLMKSLNLGNGPGLEKRIKKELQEQGIIDNDYGNEDDDDEILSELKRSQAELRAVSAHNNTQLQQLLRHARDALVRHDLKKKLRDADAKVIEAYRVIAAAKQKKKTPTKKEKDAALKALKDRDAIVRHPDLS